MEQYTLNDELQFRGIKYEGPQSIDALYKLFGILIRVSGRMDEEVRVKAQYGNVLLHIGDTVLLSSDNDVLVANEGILRMLFKEYIY